MFLNSIKQKTTKQQISATKMQVQNEYLIMHFVSKISVHSLLKLLWNFWHLIYNKKSKKKTLEWWKKTDVTMCYTYSSIKPHMVIWVERDRLSKLTGGWTVTVSLTGRDVKKTHSYQMRLDRSRCKLDSWLLRKHYIYIHICVNESLFFIWKKTIMK